MKYFIFLLLIATSFNSYAASKILATVNSHDITQAAVDNFRSHVKRTLSIKEALSEMITIEIVASKRMQSPIKPDSALQLELDRNRKAIIASDGIQAIISGFKMTKDELQLEYEKQYLSDAALQEYNANHILVKTKKEADEIIVKLTQNADFIELAKQHSTGPSGKNGGSLGWFSKGKMVKPFSDATMALSKGSFTAQPVKTQFGWHIIKLNDVRKKVPPSLKSVAKKITSKNAAIHLSKQIQELYKSSNVIIHTP